MSEKVSPSSRAEHIKARLMETFAACGELFERVPTVELSGPSHQSIPSAVAQTVIMQMLSGKAADTIYSRVKKRAAEKKCGDWELSIEDYRSAGISQTKADTIVRFAEYYRDHKALVDSWPAMKEEELIKEISRHKGIGEWTASILALSHFGKEDVFPHQDGILKKAIGLIEARYRMTLDPEKAQPYRSYLAHYLWGILDKGLFGGLT